MQVQAFVSELPELKQYRWKTTHPAPKKPHIYNDMHLEILSFPKKFWMAIIKKRGLEYFCFIKHKEQNMVVFWEVDHPLLGTYIGFSLLNEYDTERKWFNRDHLINSLGLLPCILTNGMYKYQRKL